MIAWARDTLGARFVLAEGMAFAAQPKEALAAACAAIPVAILGDSAHCIRSPR